MIKNTFLDCLSMKLIPWFSFNHVFLSVFPATGLSMYISHLTPDNKELRILELVQNITSFGVQCVIDLLCQVDINSRGGLANWLPFSIKNADKILVVVTPNYLRVRAVDLHERLYLCDICVKSTHAWPFWLLEGERL